MLERIQGSAYLATVLQRGRLLTVAGFSQLVVQAAGFACGIVVIRLLPTDEYALYILANTMLGTMGVLADGGISMGVTAQGGKVWRNPERLGAVIATGLDLRKKFGVASLVVALPLMYALLTQHGAPLWMALLIILAIIPAFFSTLSAALLQVAPKLQQDIVSLQKNQVTAHLMRLALLTSTVFIFPFAFVAILAGGIPQIWANLKLKAIAFKYAYWNQEPDLEVRTEILRFVRRILPGSIYFCFSSQLTIWLISIFGSTMAIAQVGALSRLVLVLTMFNILVNLLIIPRFARLATDRRTLLDWYVRIQTYLICACATLIGIVWIFPHEVLWVLGPRYSALHQELLLCFVGGTLNLWVGINYALNTSRGWLMHPVIGISIGIAGIIAGLLLMDVSTLRGVLWFNIFTGVVGMLVHPLYGLLRILKTADAAGHE